MYTPDNAKPFHFSCTPSLHRAHILLMGINYASANMCTNSLFFSFEDPLNDSNWTAISICFYSLFPFTKDQVRVLIFRECDWTGRRLLFDSNSVQEVCISPEEQATWKNLANNRQSTDQQKGTAKNYIDVCNGFGYVYAHTANDSGTMGEMIFGAVAMSLKGTSLKVS